VPGRLIDYLFGCSPCRITCDLRPVFRNDNKVVLKIGTIVDLGGRNANAAIIWPGRKGRIRVVIHSNGRTHLDWPDLDIDQIAGKICEFCGSKTSQFLRSPCQHKAVQRSFPSSQHRLRLLHLGDVGVGCCSAKISSLALAPPARLPDSCLMPRHPDDAKFKIMKAAPVARDRRSIGSCRIAVGKDGGSRLKHCENQRPESLQAHLQSL